MSPIPIPPEPDPQIELLKLRAMVALFEQFERRVREEEAERGHVTKSEIRLLLTALDQGKKAIGK